MRLPSSTSTVRCALGSRIRNIVACGGAPLDVVFGAFLQRYAACTMIQGYGMTETAAPIAANRVNRRMRSASVGQARRRVIGVRTADDGELQVKGPKRVSEATIDLPEKTAEAFTDA